MLIFCVAGEPGQSFSAAISTALPRGGSYLCCSVFFHTSLFKSKKYLEAFIKKKKMDGTAGYYF